MLLVVVSLMSFGLAYETRLKKAFREMYYNQGISFLNVYLPGEETRAPIAYGTGLRAVTNSDR
jgi:hypothetical protein